MGWIITNKSSSNALLYVLEMCHSYEQILFESYCEFFTVVWINWLISSIHGSSKSFTAFFSPFIGQPTRQLSILSKVRILVFLKAKFLQFLISVRWCQISRIEIFALTPLKLLKYVVLWKLIMLKYVVPWKLIHDIWKLKTKVVSQATDNTNKWSEKNLNSQETAEFSCEFYVHFSKTIPINI